jgi:hypothetical protein
MSTLPQQDLAGVLETVKQWPPQMRVSLARMILETVETPAMLAEALAQNAPARRGRPVEELIGLGAGSGPPPSDDLVRQWIDEHRMEKYGP